MLVLVLSLILDFATTEVALSIGTVEKNNVLITFVETNALYTMLGKWLFWSLYCGANLLLMGFFLHIVHKVSEKPTRRHLLALKIAYIVIWAYTVFRLISAINNAWQIVNQ